ncbi:MAG: hypothetical protein OIF57_13135 [Marinobacterium sp.]|nr:hypothetical protein [Marinobacterium sp.]
MMQTAEQEDADALKVAQMLYKARLSGDQFSGSQLSRSQPSGNQSSGSQRLSEQPSPLHTAPLSSSEQYTLKLQYQPGQQHPSPMQKRYLRQFLDSLPGSTPHLQLRCITSTAGDRFEERFENSHQALQRCHSLGIHLQTLGVQSVARLSPNGTAHSVELSLPTVADRVQE